VGMVGGVVSVCGAGSEDPGEDAAGLSVSIGGEGLGFLDIANVSFTGAVPSSRWRPTTGTVPSAGGGVLDVEAGDADATDASASARAICSAMSMRSRCSSDVTARSFFIFASYTRARYEVMMAQ
jgi:hypothetical protein